MGAELAGGRPDRERGAGSGDVAAGAQEQLKTSFHIRLSGEEEVSNKLTCGGEEMEALFQ